MARRKAAPEPEIVVPTGPGRWQEFADDFRVAAPAIGRIIHKQQLGDLAAFEPNVFQRDMFDTVMRIRAFGYVRSLQQLKNSALEKKLLRPIMKQAYPDRVDFSFSEAVEGVFLYGPGRAFREAKEFTGTSLMDTVRMVLGKPRQIGFSTALTWICAHRTAFIKNHRGLVAAHETQAAINIFQTLFRYFEAWPAEFVGFKPTLNSKARERGALATVDGSRIDVKSASGGDIRSFKYDVLLLDECAHYDSDQAVSAIVLAVPEHCWVFKLSTANGVAGAFYDDYKHARNVAEVIESFDKELSLPGWNQYFKWFMPWFEAPEYAVPMADFERRALEQNLDEYERALLDRHPDKITLEHLQFRRNRIAASRHPLLTPEQLFAQEFPANEQEMFQNSGSRLFDGGVCDLNIASAPEPVSFRVTETAEPQLVSASASNFAVWEAPIKGCRYTAGCDPSNHRPDGDASVISVFKRIDGIRREQVAEWRGRLITGNTALAHVYAFIMEWYNGAFAIPESNMKSTVETLANVLQYSPIYRMQRIGGHHDKFSSDSYDYGYNAVSNQTKRDLCDRLIYDFNAGNVIIRSIPTLEEMKLFESDGMKYGAPEGYHDDGVIAAALANWGDNTLLGAPPIVERVVGAAPTIRTDITLSLNDQEWLAIFSEEKRRMEQQWKKEASLAKRRRTL